MYSLNHKDTVAKYPALPLITLAKKQGVMDRKPGTKKNTF